MSELSLPQQLWGETLDKLVNSLQLTEVLGDGGGPYMSLQSQAPFASGEVGNVRVFKGDHIHQVVTCSLVVPAIHLDSHMLFAFMPPESPVPHFTLDSVSGGEHFAFHLDLIPRVDLGAHLDYMDAVFTPLTELLQTGRAVEGLSPAQLDPRQYAVMSPWMFVSRATADAFQQIHNIVDGYLGHWLTLVGEGVPSSVLGGADAKQLAERDQRNKAIIFDPNVDKVWNQIQGLIGEQACLELRNLLKASS